MSDGLGRLHFWGSLVCMNVVFFPMFIQGLGGLNRRLYDGGITYSHGQALQHWNVIQGWAAWALGLFQLVFLVNLVINWRRGQITEENPWQATTLEWAAPSPPPHGNFPQPVRAYRAAYEYSVPGAAADFSPQNVHEGSAPEVPHDEFRTTGSARTGGIRYETDPRPDTGVNNVTLGMWLFIASEVMLFGELFSAYVLLRTGAPDWARAADGLHLALGTVNTVTLILSCAAIFLGRRRYLAGDGRRGRLMLIISLVLSVAFLGIKTLEYSAKVRHGIVPSTDTFHAVYFLLTSVHALHVLGGVVATALLAGRAPRMWQSAPARFSNRLAAIALYWYFVDVVWMCLFFMLYVV